MNGTTNHTANENTSENNFSNSWMDHPAMKGMDPVKLELIRLAAKQTAGKSGRSLAPVMMALINSFSFSDMRKEEGQFKALLLCASYGVLFSFLPFPILLFLLPSQGPVLAP